MARQKRNYVVFAAIMVIWAVAVGAVVYFTLTRTASATARLLPVYSVERDDQAVSLTFNCAWDETGLDELLSILKENGVRCTFFIVGDFAERCPEAVRKICNAGHELGNHSMDHKDPVGMHYADLLADITACNELLYALTGERVTLYRAPSGSYNDETVAAAQALGMTAIQWDVDSVDWKDKTPEEIAKRILGGVGCGSIALFHVGKENTVQAIPEIINALQDEGYSFCTVSELLPEGETYLDSAGRLHVREKY